MPQEVLDPWLCKEYSFQICQSPPGPQMVQRDNAGHLSDQLLDWNLNAHMPGSFQRAVILIPVDPLFLRIPCKANAE